MTGSVEEDPIRLSSRLRNRAIGEEGVLLNLDNDRIIVVISSLVRPAHDGHHKVGVFPNNFVEAMTGTEDLIPFGKRSF